MLKFVILVLIMTGCGTDGDDGKNGKDGAPGVAGINGKNGDDNHIILTKYCTLKPSTGYLNGSLLAYNASILTSGDTFINVDLNTGGNFNNTNSMYYAFTQYGAINQSITLAVDGYNWLDITMLNNTGITVVVNSTNGNGSVYTVTNCTVYKY